MPTILRTLRDGRALAASLAAALALVAWSCSSGSSNSSATPISAKLTPGKSVTLAADRIAIVVPPGAVADDMIVQIVKSKTVIAATGTQIGTAYSTIPNDIAFAVPAEATYHYQELTLPSGADENNLQLAFLGPSGLPTYLPTTIDSTAKTAVAMIPTLGTIALVLSPTPVVIVNGPGTLVFLRGGAESLPDLWQALPDGSIPQLVHAHTPGERISSPRVSTVAGIAAFTETSGGGLTNKAWIVGLNGAGATQVTLDGSEETVGDLDVDGLRLYVSHREPGAPFDDIVVYSLAVGPPFPRALLTNTPNESESNPRLSPDGATLLFQDSQLHVWRMPPVAGSAAKKVVTTPVVTYAWRPDSQRIVVQRPLSTGGSTGNPPPGGGLLELNPLAVTGSLGTALKGSGGALSPTYSPNGNNLLFQFQDDDPTVLAPTLRQIPRKGVTGSIPLGGAALLGGAPSVFLGEAPTSVP